MNKRGFVFSFAWIFAIVAGATILFLAIYAAVNIIGAERYHIDTATAAQLSVIFEPLETGLASGKAGFAKFSEETRIFETCNENYKGFGKNGIRTATKSSLLEEWEEPGGEITIQHKYLFSNSSEQGKSAFILSKSLELPFKVADLISFSFQEYCFIDLEETQEIDIPEFILDEFPLLGRDPGYVCKTTAVNVCFMIEGEPSHLNIRCDVKVWGCSASEGCEYEYYYGRVEKKKGGRTYYLYYIADLIYPAIYSEPEIYRCNVKRLMTRLVKESRVYQDESKFLSGGGCGTVNFANFEELKTQAEEIKRSANLDQTDISIMEGLNNPLFINTINNLNKQNDAAECELW